MHNTPLYAPVLPSKKYKQPAKEYRSLWKRFVTALGGRKNLAKVFARVNYCLLSEYYATEMDTIVLKHIHGTTLNIKVIEKPTSHGRAKYTAILYLPMDKHVSKSNETIIASQPDCDSLHELYPVLLELVLKAYTVQPPRKLKSLQKIAIAALTPPPTPPAKQSMDALLDACKGFKALSLETSKELDEPFALISNFWGNYLGQTLSPKDVALMMALLKIGQDAKQHKPENLVYAAAYLSLANDMAKSV